VIKELTTRRFITDGENMLLLEPLGVGKTHLVEALGMNICRPAFGRWDEIIPIDWRRDHPNRLARAKSLLSAGQLALRGRLTCGVNGTTLTEALHP